MIRIRRFFLVLSLPGFLISSGTKAQPYKQLMDDPSVNIYDVIAAAEEWFKDKPQGMGTGYKDFQRWRHYHEMMFYPSGDRSAYHPQQNWDAFHAFRDSKGFDDRSMADSVWTELGPWNANNITTHYSPGLGRIDAIYVDPLDSNFIYIGARNGGFWKTTDEGITWTNTMDQLSKLGVSAIGVSPYSHDTVLARTSTGPFSSASGIWRSVDAGSTWIATQWNTTFGGGSIDIRQIKFSPGGNGAVYAATNQGLYRSFDYFQTWTQLITGNIFDIEFQPGKPSRMYLRSDTWNDSIMISVNSGVNWTGVYLNAGGNGGELDVTKDDSLYVYFGRTNGVWRSTDAGLTWTKMGNGPGGLYGGFGVLDTDKNRIIHGNIDAHLSTDGGVNFNQVSWWSNPGNSSAYVHADIREVISLQGRFYLGTDGYLAKSNNGGTKWTRHSDGCGVREFYRIGTSPTHAYYITGGSQDNGTSWLEGKKWFEWLGADGMECAYNRSNPEIFYGEWQYGGLHLTTTGGNNWPSIKPPGVGNGSWITPFVMDYNHPYTIYIGFDTLWKSTNNGSVWSKAGDFAADLDDLAIAQTDSDILLASEDNDLFLTTDGGANWSSVSGSLPNRTISDIAIHPDHPDTIAISYSTTTTAQQIYLTMNGGTTWTNISYDFPKLAAWSLGWDTHPVDRLYAATTVGVYEKTISATSWGSYVHNMPWGYVRELEIQPGANLVRAAFYGRGLWEADLLGKEEYPKILASDILPKISTAHPTEHQDVSIRSWITSVDTVQSAWIRWSAGSPTFANTIFMSSISTDTFLTITKIPKQAPGTIVWFKVFAVDTDGDTSYTERIVYRVEPYNCSGVTINANAGLPQSICPGDTASISGFGGSLYTWTGLGDGQTKDVSPAVTTTYYLTAYDMNGCSGSDSVLITVWNLPPVSLGPDSASCSSIVLDAGSYASFSWNTGDVSQQVVAVSSGIYAVEVTDVNGCKNSDSVQISIYTPPSVTLNLLLGDTLCEDDSIQILAGGNPPGGTWSGSGVSGSQFDPALAGQGLHILTYSFTDTNGCSGNANDSVFVKDCTVEWENGPKDVNFTVFPNPATLGWIAEWDANAGWNYKVSILNIAGLVMQEWKDLDESRLQMERNNLPTGAYLIQLSSESGIHGLIRLILED